jgi:hypothetical protein
MTPWKRWKVTAEDFRNRSKRAATSKRAGDAGAHRHPLGALDGGRRQQQESGAHCALSAVADALEGNCSPKAPAADPRVEALGRAAFGKDG